MKNPRTVLITGGTGFIGSNLAMRLLETDRSIDRIVLFDRDPAQRQLTGFASPNPDRHGLKDRYTPVEDRIAFLQGDLSILPHVLAVFDEHEPDSMFHLGALLSAGALRPRRRHLLQLVHGEILAAHRMSDHLMG